MTKKKTTPPPKPRTKALPTSKKKKTTTTGGAGPPRPKRAAPPTTGGAGPPDPPSDPRIVALRQVADWILRGENEISIREAIRATFPDFEALELLTAARDYLGELAGTDPELRRTWHIAARRELYRRTVEIHDFKTARDIIRDLAQLEGLYPRMTPTRSKTDKTAATEELEASFPTADGFPIVQ